MTITDLVVLSTEMAAAKGFSESPVNIDQKLLLAVGELIEAQEELRAGHSVQRVYYTGGNGAHVVDPENPVPASVGKPEGFGIELADAVIRIAHLAGACGLDLEGLIATKLAYNATRPHKHGKVF